MPSKPSPKLSPRESSVLGNLAHWLVLLWQRVSSAWHRFAVINQQAPWFPLALGALVAFDALVVVIPGDAVVALVVLSNPQGWRKTAAISGVGSALGAFALYLLILHFGKAPLDQMTASGIELPHLESARGFFNHWGLASLAIGSVIPGFTWPPVVMAGLSTSRWPEVLGWLLLGRTVRFFIISFSARESWAMVHAVRLEALDRKAKKAAKR
ncbi:MAG TPA: VTT domain-containing protein [bacterium]|jgi:membrane protein DedA with SNARE-associated domain|nr:VTT domain-containing protein [bacterium]